MAIRPVPGCYWRPLLWRSVGGPSVTRRQIQRFLFPKLKRKFQKEIEPPELNAVSQLRPQQYRKSAYKRARCGHLIILLAKEHSNWHLQNGRELAIACRVTHFLQT